MKPVTCREELRWALEDMGDTGRPLLEYIQSVLEYADYLQHTAEEVVDLLGRASNKCERKSYDYKDAELDDLSEKLSVLYSMLRDAVEEYGKI